MSRWREKSLTQAELKSVSVQGGAVLVVGRVFRMSLNIVSMLVLARLLVPEDFGLFAMVAGLMNLLILFIDPGLSVLTVQRQGITEQQVSNLFWINVSLGILLTILAMILAPVLTWFYHENQLTLIIYAMASTFFFTGLSIQHEALLRKEMRFKALVGLEVLALVASIGIALSLALYKANVWALVSMPIVAIVVKTIGLWLVVGWLPRLPARQVGMREMVEFGGHLTFSNLITYLMKNVDDMLIGWRWGAASLGIYNMAYRIFLLPVQQLTGGMSSVAIVSLSRLAEKPEEFKVFYLRLVMMMAYLSMPLVVFVGVLSDDIFMLILGEKWVESAGIFKVFAYVAILQPVGATLGWVVIACGQPQKTWRWSLFAVPLMLMGFAIGLYWGSIGVAVGYAVMFYILKIPHALYFLHDTPVHARDFWGELARPFGVAVAVAVGIFAVQYSLNLVGVLALLVGALVGCVAVFFVALLFPKVRSDIMYISDTIRDMVKSRSHAKASAL